MTERLGVGELTMHYRPLPSPSAPITCGVTHGCVTAVLDDVTCPACRSASVPHMLGDAHNVRQCQHAGCRAVQQHERISTPLADRRQRAREALYDARASIRELPAEVDPVDVAIETATRVRLDDFVVHAALAAVSAGPAAFGRYHAAIKAAFKAAGFEVEQ